MSQLSIVPPSPCLARTVCTNPAGSRNGCSAGNVPRPPGTQAGELGSGENWNGPLVTPSCCCPYDTAPAKRTPAAIPLIENRFETFMCPSQVADHDGCYAVPSPQETQRECPIRET